MNKTGDLVTAGGVDQNAGSQNVGFQENRRTINRAVDMAFRREIHDNIVAGHQFLDQLGVPDVALNERVVFEGVQFIDGGFHAGIRQKIEVGYQGVRFSLEDHAREIGADEPRSPCDEIAASHRGRSSAGTSTHFRLLRSRSERMTSLGQSTARSGSFHKTPCSSDPS